MSILSDRDIIKSKKTGSIVISEFSENNLTPNGYDLHISEIFISRVGDVQKNGTVSIPSGDNVLCVYDREDQDAK